MTEVTAIVPVAEIAPRVELGVIRADGPKELVRVATEAADALRDIIKSKKLFSNIQGKEYVKVEGWTTLATMMGCLPREVSVTRTEQGTYMATVELVRMSDQAVLTRASAECGMDEPTWAKRADYARRSMAVTRATSKACRIAFSWVMVLAGYEATPSEEIPERSEATERGGAGSGKSPTAGRAPGVVAAAPTLQPLEEFPHGLEEAADDPLPTVTLPNVEPPPANKPEWRKTWLFGALKGRELWTLSTEELANQLKWAEKANRAKELQPIIRDILQARGGVL